MSTRRLILLMSAGLLLAINTFSYTQDYMNLLHGRYFGHPGAEMQHSEQAITFYDWRIEGVLPYSTPSGNIFGIKPQWKRIFLGSESGGPLDLNLYSIKMPFFTYLKFGNSGWSLYADISPKINSDLQQLTLRHFQIGGMALFCLERKQGFFWQFGFFYNQDTYGPFIMPLAGVDWRMNERNYLAALIPAYFIYERKISGQLYLGVEVELSGETYRLGESEHKNSFISQLGENKMTFLTEPHFFIDWYLTRNLVAYVKPGFRLFEKYEHFTEGDILISDSEYLTGTLKNSFAFEVGIALRYRYDEEE